MTTPMTVSTRDPALFVRNMSALWRLDSKLALAVDAIDDERLPPLEPTRCGGVTVARQAPDGKAVYLHSRYDPQAEAAKWADHVLEADKFCYLIQGFGLGYHAKALFQRLTGDVIVLILEPDVHMVRLGLSVLDFSEELDSGRLAFVCQSRKDWVHQRLSPYSSIMMMGTKIAAHTPSTRISKPQFQALADVCLAYIDYAKTGMVTLVTNAQVTCRNVANNLGTYLASPPINELKARFAGHPAIIVSAGPSLRRNMQQLHHCRDRAVVIATQTTFKPLKSSGIVPAFVCSLDYHELSRQYYEGVDPGCDTHLVAEPKAHHSVIDAYCGPISLLSNEFARLCLGSAHGERDGLPAGASVAHLAFYLAQYMSCDPIILIGQDLALTDHVYHAPGTAIHESWSAELNRFGTLEMKEWDRIMRSKPILRKVPDAQGRELFTEELMFNYLEQFEKDIAATHARVINATEGGALIRGAQIMTLRQAIDAYCRQTIPERLLAYRRRQPWFDASKLPAGQHQIRQRLDDMEAIRGVCDQTTEVLQELTRLIDRPAEFNRKIKTVDALRLKVAEYERAYSIITAGAQLAEFRRFSADQRLKASGAVGADRARKQLDRDLLFVQQLRADTDRMIAILQSAAERIDARWHAAAGTDPS